MAEALSYICLAAVFFVNVANSDIFIGDLKTPKNSIDSCTSECIKKVALDSNSLGGRESCSRGCRFFAIAQLIDRCQILDQESTRDTCKSSCIASYGESSLDSNSCVTGCTIPVPKAIQIPLVSEFTWSFLQDNGESLQIFQGFVPEPDDVLTDPSLRGQVSKVESLRIPEMRVRTLPVSQFKEEGANGWWGGCGQKLPHCLAASLLLLLILLALWFGLSLEDPPRPEPLAPPQKAPLV